MVNKKTNKQTEKYWVMKYQIRGSGHLWGWVKIHGAYMSRVVHEDTGICYTILYTFFQILNIS